LADIGLVAGAGFTSSMVGTIGFLPGEGSGDWRADLYALGKVLYEASTGMDRNAFPDLPAHVRNNAKGDSFIKLNRIFIRACTLDVRDGYSGAAKLTEELEQINAPSIFAGPFSWREKRLIALVAALIILLFVSDSLLIYLGLKNQNDQVAVEEKIQPAKDQLRGKFESEEKVR